MVISNQKNKLTTVITAGTKEDVSVFLESIQRGIDFYLCRHPYQPINQEQAGNIYFLKCLDKLLSYEPSKESKTLGSIICTIPNNDQCLVTCITDSLDNTLSDLLNHGAEHTLDRHLSEASFFLSKIRKAFSPGLKYLYQAELIKIAS